MRFAKHGFKLVKRTIPLLVGVGLFIITLPAYANQLPQRSLTLSNASPAVQAQYKLAFTITTAGTLGSIRLQFCANDPLIGGSCVKPAGFDLQTASLSTQNGEIGFVKSPQSTDNILILSRTPAAAQAIPSEYVFDNVTNPTSTGSYYVRLETFASDDASGPDIDKGGLAFSISDLLQISAEVPPYLTFCAAIVIDGLDCETAHGSYIDFGELSAARPAAATSQLLVATNAASGYGLSVIGSTLASGNNVINALTSADISRPGTSQFGLNLRANTNPAIGFDVAGPGNGLPMNSYNQADHYIFQSGNPIAGAIGSDDYRRYTVSYLVNVPPSQAPGIYVSTLTFIATGNF